MNEFCYTTTAAAKIRNTLLATASAVVLAAYGESASAAGDDRPTVWIEGGWHFESVTGDSDILVPPLDAYTGASGFPSLTTLEKAQGRTYGGEGSISFQPRGSDWVFAISGRYGRVQTTRNSVERKTIVGSQMLKFVFGTENGGNANVQYTPSFDAYAIGYSRNSEAHAIVDFQVGKDVGVGLLGSGTDSIISFGARYAQMSAKSKAHSYANPDVTFQQITSSGFFGHKYKIQTLNHRSAAFVERTDNLRALGPSISLKNTTGLLGTVDDGQLALDWGMNAALLFGRQKAKASHHSTVRYFHTAQGGGPSTSVYPLVTRARSRMITIPNIGGFAGLSFRFSSAKVSAGYRADFFFGARDGGLETRDVTDVSFHGPYASVSIGFGG